MCPGMKQFQSTELGQLTVPRSRFRALRESETGIRSEFERGSVEEGKEHARMEDSIREPQSHGASWHVRNGEKFARDGEQCVWVFYRRKGCLPKGISNCGQMLS